MNPSQWPGTVLSSPSEIASDLPESPENFAIKVGREVRVGMQEWDVSTRDAKAGHWDEAHQDPVSDEQGDNDDGPGSRPHIKVKEGCHQVADPDPLENSGDAHAGRRRERQNRAVVHRQTDGEDNDCAAKSVEQQLAPRITSPEAGFEGEDQRNSDDEEEEREDKIGGGPAIPFGMFQRPVRMTVSGIIDQDHGRDGNATKQVERTRRVEGAGYWRAIVSRPLRDEAVGST